MSHPAHNTSKPQRGAMQSAGEYGYALLMYIVNAWPVPLTGYLTVEELEITYAASTRIVTGGELSDTTRKHLHEIRTHMLSVSTRPHREAADAAAINALKSEPPKGGSQPGRLVAPVPTPKPLAPIGSPIDVRF